MCIRDSGQLSALLPPHAAIQKGKLHVFQSVETGDQMESLKDEADVSASDIRLFIVGQAGNVLAFEEISSGRWDVQTSQNVH